MCLIGRIKHLRVVLHVPLCTAAATYSNKWANMVGTSCQAAARAIKPLLKGIDVEWGPKGSQVSVLVASQVDGF